MTQRETYKTRSYNMKLQDLLQHLGSPLWRSTLNPEIPYTPAKQISTKSFRYQCPFLSATHPIEMSKNFVSSSCTANKKTAQACILQSPDYLLIPWENLMNYRQPADHRFKQGSLPLFKQMNKYKFTRSTQTGLHLHAWFFTFPLDISRDNFNGLIHRGGCSNLWWGVACITQLVSA